MRSRFALVAGLCAAAVVVGLAHGSGQDQNVGGKTEARVGVYLDTSKLESSNESSDSSDQSASSGSVKGLPSPTPQAGVVATQQSLQGLVGIRVVVKKHNLDTAKYGLTFDELQTEIESRLRSRGVQVVAREEYSGASRTGILHIDVLPLIAEATGFCAVSINVALVQNVILTGQDTTRLCQATTWERRTVALCDTESLKEIPKTVVGFVDQFVKDYIAANSTLRQPANGGSGVEPWSPAGEPQPTKTPRKSPLAHLMV